MAKVKAKSSSNSTRQMRPALTPEADENQMISLAMGLARQRLLDGTASSQEVTHFLKLGSSKAILERDKLREENKLLQAKTEALQLQKRTEELFAEAVKAIKRYSGNGGMDDEDEDDY